VNRDKTGCSCKPVKIDKLSVGKIKSELSLHGHLIGLAREDVDKLTKAELTSKMREVLKNCPMCVASNCECVKLGVG